MRLEDRLKDLPSGFTGARDPEASLDAVLRAGRRKRAARLGAIATGVLGVAASVAVATALVAPPAPPRIAPVGPGTSTAPGAASPTPEPSTSGRSSASPLEPRAAEPAASPPPPSPGPEPSDGPVVDDFPSEPSALQLSVRTDRGTYETGERVTITVQACNDGPDPHEEYFFEEGSRFTLRVLTDDRRAIAYASPEGGDQDATEVWAPGECRSWSEVWDQTEGDFDEPGGQQAEPGDHTVLLDWHGVPPPPPGTDPRLYDPAARGGAESPAFMIEQPAGPVVVPSAP